MRRSGRLSFFIVLAAALAAGAAAGISTFLMKQVVTPESSKTQKVEIVPITFMYPLSEQIVNLIELGRFLKVGIGLEILAKGSPSNTEQNTSANHGSGGHGEGAEAEKPLPPIAAATKAELDEKPAKILDAVIEELSTSSFRELLTPQGQRNLRERIKRLSTNS